MWTHRRCWWSWPPRSTRWPGGSDCPVWTWASGATSPNPCGSWSEPGSPPPLGTPVRSSVEGDGDERGPGSGPPTNPQWRLVRRPVLRQFELATRLPRPRTEVDLGAGTLPYPHPDLPGPGVQVDLPTRGVRHG